MAILNKIKESNAKIGKNGGLKRQKTIKGELVRQNALARVKRKVEWFQHMSDGTKEELYNDYTRKVQKITNPQVL